MEEGKNNENEIGGGDGIFFVDWDKKKKRTEFVFGNEGKRKATTR